MVDSEDKDDRKNASGEVGPWYHWTCPAWYVLLLGCVSVASFLIGKYLTEPPSLLDKLLGIAAFIGSLFIFL